MIDIEVKQGMSTEAFRDSVAKFLVMVEKAYHQKPLVYTGTNFYNKYLVGVLDDYKLMIAQYSKTNQYWQMIKTICYGSILVRDTSMALRAM